jgi:murein DD-endopeptidase MepM/ murein hydrolase activator NlpD
MSRGRHRRTRTSRRITIATLAVTTGGAGIVMPLIGASGASAASVDTWDKVAACESTGNWSINSGNGFYGGLQFTESTWSSFGGTEFAPRADLATKDQQIAIAEKVLEGQGPGAWPVCSGEAGLTRGGEAPAIDTGSGEQEQSGSDAEPETLPAPKAEKAEKKAESKPSTGGSDSAKTTSYTVVGGDTLFKIAKAQGVEGGWKSVYEDNRDVVGGDPDLIFPGQKFTLGGKAEAEPKAEKSEAPKAEAPALKAPQQESGAEQAADSVVDSAASGFSSPVDASTSTPYRASGGSWSSGYHTGVDFSVSTGSTVKSVGSGEVVSAGWAGSYGNQVVIQHEDGKYSQYAHLSSLSVSAGQSVEGGEQIGLSGSTGNSTGPHLHFEIRTSPDYGSDVDPIAYLRAQGVNL